MAGLLDPNVAYLIIVGATFFVLIALAVPGTGIPELAALFAITVSAYAVSGSQATFTLTLPADSAFTALTGATTVQIYQQAGTQLHGLTTIANTNDVVVRGLLFFDTTSSTYKFVASWVVAP